MSTDSNSLAREFLTDVNRLCNAVVQRAEAREEEEETHMATLGQYLVHGRGFLLLTKLNSTIDQALTCREELLTLLLSLLPLVWKIPVQEEKAADFNLPFSPGIILTKEKNSNSQRSAQEKLYLEGSAPSGQVPAKFSVFRKSRRQRKITHRYSVRDARKTQLSTSESEANSDDRSVAANKPRRPHQLPRSGTQSSREDGLAAQPARPSAKEQSPPGTMASESFQIMPGQAANADVLSEPAALSIISHMNNSPFDLCHVLLSLLEKVCKFDIALNHNSALAASVVPTLTEFLAGFGDCRHLSDNLESQMVAAGWTEEPVALIQRMLFRTALHLMSVDISTAETMPERLRKNLTELLRAALKIRTCPEKQPDPFAPRQKGTLQEVRESFVFSKCRHRALLLPELLEGVLQILVSCLQSAASNPSFFGQAVDLVQDFIQHHGFNLFETAVLQMEWLILRDSAPAEASEHLKALINGVLKIMSAVKRAKAEQLHHSVCPRKRHRRCEFAHFLHHHSDLSGLLASAFRNQVSGNPFAESADGDGDARPPARCCCVAVCAHRCLRTLQRASLSSTCVQILSGVHRVGVCCCMDPKSVIVPVLHALKLPALKNFQQPILNILNKLILDQLGGAEVSQKIRKAACNICTADSDQGAKLGEALALRAGSRDAQPRAGVPSPSCTFQGILPSRGSEDLLWKWDALEVYQSFVFEEDGLLSAPVAHHICSLLLKGNVAVQWKLYHCVLNPVLRRAVELAHHCRQLSVPPAQTHVCSHRNQCLPWEVLQIYLKTLPTLLKSRIIRDLFLSCNGVSQIIELNCLDGIRSHSLKAFETLIISLGEQREDSSISGTDGVDTEQESSSLNAGASFHNQQAYPESPPSLSKFYTSLREAYPKKRKSANQDVHIDTINLFLCVAFLCVSKEAESDAESANDSGDTSGYDSTASEPLLRVLPRVSLESLVLPSREHMQQAADIWAMCRWIYTLSPVFQKQFCRLGGFRACYKLIFMIIQELFRSHKQEQGQKGNMNVYEHQDLTRTSRSEIPVKEDLSPLPGESPPTLSGPGSPEQSADTSGDLESQQISSINLKQVSATAAAPEETEFPTSRESEVSLQSIRLLEALLAICLHSSRARQQKTELEGPDQNLSVENILFEMRDHLSRSKVIETELAKPFFDALLRVAQGSHSAEFERSDAVAEKGHQSEELSSQPGDFSEEAEDSQCCSFKLWVEEEGYEADSESNPEDSDTWDDGIDVKPEAEGFVASSSPNGLLENLSQGELIYPEICMLELSLLSTGKANLDVLTYVFESFLKIVRQKEKNIFLLIQQGTVKSLLGGFLSILTQADSDFQACQRVLVDLLVSLMSSRTCSEELTLLLRIFLEKSPCTEILLLGILKIVESDIAMSPLQYLTFPVMHTPHSSSGVSSQRCPGSLSSKAMGLLRRAHVSRSKKEADGDSFPQQLFSPWQVAPVHLPLPGQNCWPHLSEGFSVSLWFNVECAQEAESATEKRKKMKKRNRSLILRGGSVDGTENNRPEGAEYMNPSERLIEEGCVHMMSLGSKALMIQVWADPHAGTLIFRMCVDSNDDAKAVLLAQAESQENVFLPSKWQHLVLTYLQQPQGKKNVHGRMSMWVSGQRKPEVTLDFVLPRKTSLSSDSNKTFCMIGHCVSSQEEFLQLAGKWDLGNLLLFNGAKIGSQEAFYLYACGPNHTSIMPCKYGKPVIDYSKYINKEILQCEQIRELFMTKKDVDIGLLIESLSVVYTTYCPAQYTIYEPVIRLKGQAKTQLSQRPFSSKEVQSILLEPHHLKNLRPTQCQTIQGILHEIGGTGIFVFLFARVVELSSCEETQALALRIILSLVKYNQQRIHELENCNGLSMIHQVLIKQKCTVGFHVLKTLLEGCCGEDILHISENGEFRLDVESNAIIHDVKLLEALLLDWKIWRKAERGVWETLLAALGALIRAEHQQQLLNVRQLLEARVVHHFLLTCQVLQEHKEGQLTSMPREVCRSFVKIIAEVLGSPPDLELLTIIFNFLLAVHPPTNTYVCHNPTNFYFSLHIDGKVFQEKVESIMYLRHSSSGGKAVPSPGLVVISPSDFTASPPEGNSSSGITPPRTTADLRRSRSLPALPTSPLAQPQKLTGSSGGGIDSLQSTADRRVDSQPEKWGPLGTSETLKKGPEDAFVSSCESAKTVCETEAVLSVQVSVNGVPKGALEYPAVKVDPKEPGAEPRSDDDSPGDESCPRRPDYLKGLASFQRSHSMIASLGLAFPSQNGAAAIGRWPSLVDRNAEVWENVTFSLGYEPNCARTANAHSVMEDCLVPICCGLYELLSGVLLILPDAMLEDVMDKLIQADVLLVLVNHPSPAIQQGVIKLLDAYFNRASKEQKDKFLKNRGFSLLANQLYLHRGTQELLECFVEMFFGRHVGLDEEFDLEDVKNMGLFQKWSVIPILGLIETSLYDNVLLHNALLLLLQILNSCSKVADMLLDNGLLYVLCNTVAALNGLEKNIPLNEYKLLACDIQQLFIAVTIHACSSSGSQYFRVIEDLIVLLGYLQNSKNKRTQNMAVALQLRVLQAAMEFIRTTANHGCEHPADSLSLPSAPHHAVFQKRKSIAGSIPMKGSTVPHLPRRHFRSYGHLPMPFSSLNQDSCSPLCPGSTPCAAPPGAGPRKFPLAQTDSLLMKMRSVASDELHVMMQRRLSQENPVQASEAELAQRLQRLTVLAVNRIIYQDFNPEIVDILSTPEYATQSKTSVSQTETSEENTHREQPSIFNPFQKEILTYLVEGFKVSIASGKSSGSKQQWTKILGSCKDTFRMQLGRLLVHVVSPAHPSQQRKQIFEIVREPSYQEILRDCLSPSLQHGAKLVLYLSELIHNHPDDLTEEELDTAEVLMNALKLCGHKCLLPSASAKPELLKMIREEQKKYEAEEGMNKTAWQKTVNNNQQSLFQRLDSKSKDISKIAADITQAVSLSQGIERKKVIQHIRGMYKVDLSASRHWQELIQQLTHDRAVWYDPVYYPTSWQLDPTEGPNRERRRLQRCYLTIPNKYLLRERQKSEDLVRPPLSYLFEDKTHSSFSSTVKDKAASESIRVNRRCISVAPSRETAGELLLGKCGMYFVEDNASDAVESSSLQGELEPASFSWTYEEIKEVHKRWWQLRDNAVEIFLTNGRTLLLAFDNTKVRDDVYHSILTNNLPNLLEYGNITALTNLWYTGQITNFEYLTHLNKHAGRSFNDLMQYPVFPFILADYVSETLDLSDPAVYRNLSKPIAVQYKEKEDRYVDTYKYLEEEYRKGAREDDPLPPVQPYHYGSHYSNSGTVLHFLVRMPPFTRMFLAYQDQSFDIPDRTFHSTNTTWRLSSFESMTDVKELIPEFFYLPEFLVNREGFDFGVRQNGERVNHVNLPPWARNDPRLFILIHRQALESEHVSQNICQWIDLVFGYKQKGKASVQAINVFHPATYFGMDVSAVEDPVQRRALETMIKTYGQTPRQLFQAAHLGRPGARLSLEGELPAAVGLLVQLAFRESREQAKEITYPSPLPWIKGLKWGEYVGSPSAPVPVVCFSQPHGERFGSLQALPTRAICGLSRNFCLLMTYSKEQGVRSMNSTDIQWSAILSWGYADNILRLKSKQGEPPINFIQSSQQYQVTSCAWVPDSCQLFTGSKCGVITAHTNRLTSSTPSEIEMESQVHLYGHTAEITSLFVCKPYSIMISVSRDGTCIIWDLNRLCYVQSLAGHKSPVTAVSASETTGDVATVCDSAGGGSDLRLWTVNGDLVGHVHCREIVCSVAFSNQPEGVSINVIAGGLENGIVRLWSTWDLKPVREITFPKSNKPIVSLTFSCDGHHLYTANSEGTVTAWCRKDQQRLKQPMFYSFLSSYAAG
ncbi:lysosomal-trafficking regulator isoform X1 [Pteropus medius]|uniref:lysosomal-trafficking regulator isoform X1 n=1 Tax=Pteropus vampyrus TaxID=132908 RepID=UPI00196B268D|nr:lysosomal-trafficking regulator isoform X1 [Pteropus giganteus]